VRKWGKEQATGRIRVWGWYLFYGTGCQWNIPAPNTLVTRAFGDSCSI